MQFQRRFPERGEEDRLCERGGRQCENFNHSLIVLGTFATNEAFLQSTDLYSWLKHGDVAVSFFVWAGLIDHLIVSSDGKKNVCEPLAHA